MTINTRDPTGVSDTFLEIYPVWSISITSNGQQLAAATSNHKINLFDVRTQVLLIALKGHSDTVWQVAYSPNDELLVSASADATVRIWEVESGLPCLILPRNHAGWAWCLRWSVDGSMLATGGVDGNIILWDADLAAQKAQRYKALVEQMEYADERNRQHYESAAQEEAMQQALACRPLLYWPAHEKSIHHLAFSSADKRQLVSSGAEGTIAVWDCTSGKLDVRLIGHVGTITCVDVSPATEEIIASGGEDHTVRLWDLADMPPDTQMAADSREKPLGMNLQHYTLKGHEAGITAIKFTGDGKLLASVSKDCDVRIWNPDMNGPTLNTKFTAHEAWIKDVLWTKDQSMLYTASTDGLVFAWKVPKAYRVQGAKRKKDKQR